MRGASAWRPDPDPKYRETEHRFWNPFERVIDPFEGDVSTPLPKTAAGFIWYFAKTAKWPFLALLVMGGLMGGVDAALYWGMGWLIDLLDTSSPARLLLDHWHVLLAALLFITVFRTLVIIVTGLVEQQMVGPRVNTLVRWHSFRRVIEQPYQFYQDDFAGRIATKVMQAGDSTGDFIVTVLQSMWSFLTFILLTISVFATLDWRMAIVVIVWFAGYVLVAKALLPRLRAAGKNNANERAVLSGRLVDIFTNILTVKLFDSRMREHSDVKTAMDHQLGAHTHLTRMITLTRTAVAVLNSTAMAAIGYLAIAGWMNGALTTGAIAAAMGIVFRLNQMSSWMMFNVNGLVRAYATIQDAVETISAERAIEDAPDAKVLDKVSGHIRFENVRFNYGKKDAQLFRDLDLDIKPGEKIGLVGPSGAGKSTVVALMLRLFDPENGRVTLDGIDIRDVTQASLREQFGVVSQDPSLMHRSLRHNIAYGKPNATEAEIIEAAKRAQAHDFILQASDPKGRTGYDAYVGERGIKLSGGQRQRIAIARVMVKDAPILILDEATSALDSEIEAAIQDNLAVLMENKTVIAIAHRLSTIAAMDRLIIVDNGRIVQQGSHGELLKDADGLYARLWARQTGGFIGVQEEAE